MRHNRKFNHLGRTSAHRELMLSNMAVSLILNKRVTTTVAKAKALRVYVEPILTRSKSDSTHARRVAFADLRDKSAVKELFGVVSSKISNRLGGYTRIVRTGTRLGDGAEMCLMELVDFNEHYSQTKGTTKKNVTRRSRRSGGNKKVESEAVEVSSENAPQQ
ncbi:MAG: 50S ribosomal protein L17 [Bacteroides sp.]